MGPLIERKFSQEGDVELVRGPPLVRSEPVLTLSPGERVGPPFVWCRAYTRTCAVICGQGARGAGAAAR